MFWHGRQFGESFIIYVKTYIHKSAAFAMVLWLYNLEAEFSGGQIYDDLYYALYKTVVTVFGVYFFLLYDQSISYHYTGRESELGFKLSHYYAYVRNNVFYWFVPDFVTWMFLALMSACICYFIPSHSMSESHIMSIDGKTEGVWGMGYTVMSILVLVHHGLVALYTRNWTLPLAATYVISLLLFFPIQTAGSDITVGGRMQQMIFTDYLRTP